MSIPVNCDLCGNDSTTMLFAGDCVCEAIVTCKNCGFIYQNPRRDIPVNYAQWAAPEIEKAIKEYEEIYLLDVCAKEKNFQRILDEISRYKKPGKMLEVGSSYGLLLNLAQKQGWDVLGIEPYTPAMEWSQKKLGLNILPTTLLEAKLPDNCFDAVLMINVLEHVTSPYDDLSETFRILKPGGLLFIEVPNMDNLWVKFLRKKWRYFLDIHYSYFTPQSMGKYLGKTGFKIQTLHSSPRIASAHYIAKRMRQLKYVGPVWGNRLEKMLLKSKLADVQLKIDLKDSMRVLAVK